MKKMMACVLLAGMAFSADAQNLLKNQGFSEIDPNAGGLAGYPASWQVFGTANRANWRSHDEGKWCIGVCGQWADIGTDASVMQSRIPVEEGKTYQLTAFFWADPEWMPRSQTLKISYYGEDSGTELAAEVMPFSGVLPVWASQTCSSIAPAGAKTASVAIAIKGVSMRGGLTIDDVYFGESPAAGQ